MSKYKSNHDCFGNPTEVPGGYPLPDPGPALVAQMNERLAKEERDDPSARPTKGVFEIINDTSARALDAIEMAQQGAVNIQEAAWLAQRLLNITETIQDAEVTYGFIPEEGEPGPMMVERDAIVRALDA